MIFNSEQKENSNKRRISGPPNPTKTKGGGVGKGDEMSIEIVNREFPMANM